MEKTFGKYRIAALIEAKPTSSVYLARLPKVSDWNMVIKIFDAVSLKTPQEQEDFLRKMRVFAQLQHASILPVLDVGIEKEHPYIVSNYMAGGSLRQHLMSPSFSDIPWGLQVISQIGNALRYAHARGIVHNNIKPENIVFDSNGTAFLMDFSFPPIEEKLTISRLEKPNVYYPQNEPPGPLRDQYALGSLASEILHRQRPPIPEALLAAKELHLLADIKVANNPSSAFEVPLHIERALQKATATMPEERYKNIAIFVSALNAAPEQFDDDILSDPVPEAVVSYKNTGELLADDEVTVKVPQEKKRKPQQKWMAVTFVVVAVVLLLSSFYIFLPALSNRHIGTAVVTPVDKAVPSAVGTGVALTPIVPTVPAQQAGKTPTQTPNVDITPLPHATSTPQPQPTPTPIPQATPTPVPTPTRPPTPTPTPTPACNVNYTVTHQWPGGFTTNIVISNTSSTDINGWRLTFAFPSDQRVTQIWNGSVMQFGNQVMITNLGYDSVISSGGTVSLGFNGSFQFGNQSPNAFSLNGSACSAG